MVSSALPAGTRYIKVELPILDDVADLSLYTVQLLYAGGANDPDDPSDPDTPSPDGPKTGVADHVPALLLPAMLSGAMAVVLARRGRKKTA